MSALYKCTDHETIDLLYDLLTNSERMQEIRKALTDISTLIADPSASPTFTYSNLCEARWIAREALAQIFPVDLT